MDLNGFFTINGLVATEPFKPISTKAKAAGGGLALDPGGQGTTIVALRIVAQSWIFQGSGGPEQNHRLLVRPGDLAYVRAEASAQPWAKSVVKMEGSDVPFILVPLRDIQGFNRDQKAPATHPHDGT